MSTLLSFTTADVERYKRLRAVATYLNQRRVKTIPKEAIHDMGRALGILRDGKLYFETEDVLSVLMDCCIHDWVKAAADRHQSGRPRMWDRTGNSIPNHCRKDGASQWNASLTAASGYSKSQQFMPLWQREALQTLLRSVNASLARLITQVLLQWNI